MGYLILFLLAFVIVGRYAYVDIGEFGTSILYGAIGGFLITAISLLVFTLGFNVTAKYIEQPIKYEKITVVENVAVVSFDVDGKKIVKSIDMNEIPTSFGSDESVVISYNEPRKNNFFGKLFWIYGDSDATDKTLLNDGEISKIIIDKSIID